MAITEMGGSIRIVVAVIYSEGGSEAIKLIGDRRVLSNR